MLHTSPRPMPPRQPAPPPDAATPRGSPFSKVVAQHANTPARKVIVAAALWAVPQDGGDVTVGLRRYAESDAVRARAEAAQRAWRLHPQHADEDTRVDAFNGIVMALLVSRCTCDPADSTIGYFGFAGGAMAEEDAQQKLTPQGVEYLFGEIDAMMTEDSPIAPVAGDEDLAWLSAALADGGAWNTMAADKVRSVRRMLMRAITDMGGADRG